MSGFVLFRWSLNFQLIVSKVFSLPQRIALSLSLCSMLGVSESNVLGSKREKLKVRDHLRPTLPMFHSTLLLHNF